MDLRFESYVNSAAILYPYASFFKDSFVGNSIYKALKISFFCAFSLQDVSPLYIFYNYFVVSELSD